MIRIIVFGAHPDDCELCFAGAARLFIEMGHAVKFVSVTNGDAGHHQIHGPALAARRAAECWEAGRRLGVAYEVLRNHDGRLLPAMEAREEIIRQIRQWNADVVLAHRPNDYHPDHRYTGILMQDAAYLVVVPSLVPDIPPLRKNPVFLFLEDHFQRPNPFRPDIAVAIDRVIDAKLESLDAHASQFYEWLPWVDGTSGDVPADPDGRKEWLRRHWTRPVNPAVRSSLAKWYGEEKANATRYYEAFEICEYGAQPDEARIRELFPMLK